MRYDAVLFDLDNTLYDYDAYWARRLVWSLEPVHAAYPAFDMGSLIERIMAEHIYAKNFVSFLNQSGVIDMQVCQSALQRYRINPYEQLELPADTLEVLRRLRQYCKTGLITNGPIYSQQPKIERLGLALLMDLLIISEEVGLAKPDPAIFHLALRRLQVRPGRALYVGDSPEYDLAGAQAAGLDCVWMNPRDQRLPPGMPPPLATISRLSQLLELPGIPA